MKLSKDHWTVPGEVTDTLLAEPPKWASRLPVNVSVSCDETLVATTVHVPAHLTLMTGAAQDHRHQVIELPNGDFFVSTRLG